MSTTHIAGTPVALEGRWLRQRCSWCGELLVSAEKVDGLQVLSTKGAGDPRAWATWSIDTLVRVHRDGRQVPVDRGVLDRPDDACYSDPTTLPPEHTRCDGTCAEPRCRNGMPQTTLQVDDQEHEQRVGERKQ